MRIFFTSLLNFFYSKTTILIFFISLFFTIYINFNSNNCENVIRADGLGYYSYLPAIFIYNDYQFSFIDDIKKNHPQINFGDGFLNKTDKGNVNKYYIGLSILLLPFFLLAHFIASIFNLSPDGYSQVYQIFILIASNFYLFIGCIFTKTLISKYINNFVVNSIILITLVFGTNLFFYASYDVSHTHVYSFALISAFLYYSYKFFVENNSNYLFFLSVLLGLITLVRPTNIVIVFMLLFFVPNFMDFWRLIYNKKREVFISIFLFLICLSPQFILYFLQTDSFIVWSYGEETFYFSNPEFFKVLFSYQKGLFVYTPLVFLSSIGLFYLFKINKYQFIVLSIFLVLITYIISSWWCWWYGGSLGQRAFVDYYSIVALLIAFSYNIIEENLKFFNKILLMGLLGFFIFYSSILSYQYRYYIIDAGNMNKQKYWFSFLKTADKYHGIVTINHFFDGTNPINIVSIIASNNKYLSSIKDENNLIVANKDLPQTWEAFNMIELGNGKLAFEVDNGKYLSTRFDKEGLLTHEANEILEWETFYLQKVEDDNYLIKSFDGKYLSRNGDKFFANTIDEGAAEKFIIERK